jgi:hypothetical protein
VKFHRATLLSGPMRYAQARLVIQQKGSIFLCLPTI